MAASATLPDQTVILETTGDPYSYFARFSSNTGLPTVLGWANHEGLWRGHDHEPSWRGAIDVLRIYNATTLAEVQPLLDRYKVQLHHRRRSGAREASRRASQKFAALDPSLSQRRHGHLPEVRGYGVRGHGVGADPTPDP